MSNSTVPVNEARRVGVARHLDEHGLIAVAWVGFSVSAFFVALRSYARYREAGRLFFDDYWMWLALTFLLVNAILQTLQTWSLYYLVDLSSGIVSVGPQLIIEGNIYVRYEFAIIGLFWSVVWSVKGSFLALYFRLLDGLPHYRRAWWAAVIFSICGYIGCWFASAWTCHPPSTYFQFGQCSKPIDQRGSTISISYSTAVDVVSDFMIMALPLRLLKDLQVTRQQKIGLAVVFSLGLIIVATAIVRMTQILGAARVDPAGLALWGLVESSIAVIVGSLPPLKAFLQKKLARYGTGGYVYGGNGNPNHYMPGSKNATGTSASRETGGRLSALHKSRGSKVLHSQDIPLEDREVDQLSDNSISQFKGGQIVVTKTYGWERTESVGDRGGAGDEHSFGTSRTIPTDGHDDEENLVGVAVSDHHHYGVDSMRARPGVAPRVENKEVAVEGKTWLRTSSEHSRSLDIYRRASAT